MNETESIDFSEHETEQEVSDERNDTEREGEEETAGENATEAFSDLSAASSVDPGGSLTQSAHGEADPPPQEITLPADEERAREELLEFAALYPEVTLGEIPEAVRCSRLPLAAAYALYEKREGLLRARAEAENKKNAQRSVGGVSGGEDVFYTPDEVRSMTREEVRANYDSIMRSMKRWR